MLVVQMAGRVGKGWADEEEKEEGVEWRSLLGLVSAALVYCAGLAGVIKVGRTHWLFWGIIAEGSDFPAIIDVFVANFPPRCSVDNRRLPFTDRLYITSYKRA